jgi:hypothetical protein
MKKETNKKRIKNENENEKGNEKKTEQKNTQKQTNKQTKTKRVREKILLTISKVNLNGKGGKIAQTKKTRKEKENCSRKSSF